MIGNYCYGIGNALGVYFLKYDQIIFCSYFLFSSVLAIIVFILSNVKISHTKVSEGKSGFFLMLNEYTHCFLYLLSTSFHEILVSSYTIFCLQSAGFDKIEVLRSFFLLQVGRLLFVFPISFISSHFHENNKLIFCSIMNIVSVVVFGLSLFYKQFFYFGCFFIGISLHMKCCPSSYFKQLCENNKINISMPITENQINSFVSIFSFIIGAICMSLNPRFGILAYLLFFHTFVFIYFLLYLLKKSD
jgi:hypothetical protein